MPSSLPSGVLAHNRLLARLFNQDAFNVLFTEDGIQKLARIYGSPEDIADKVPGKIIELRAI